MTQKLKSNALEMAEADMRSGDYGLARQRLESHIAAKGYDADLMNRLGRISYDMHDPYNAGRHWIVSAAEGPEVDHSIAVFLRRAGTHPHQIGMQVLRAARLPSFAEYPPSVRTRIERLGLKSSFEGLCDRRSIQYPTNGAAKLITILVVIALIFVVGFIIIGLIAVGDWLWT